MNCQIQPTRQEEAACLQTVQSQRQEPGMQALLKLLKIRLAKQDKSLRVCPQADLQVSQGRAQVIDELIREINGTMLQLNGD